MTDQAGIKLEVELFPGQLLEKRHPTIVVILPLFFRGCWSFVLVRRAVQTRLSAAALQASGRQLSLIVCKSMNSH